MNALIAAAAAQISGHLFDDLLVGGGLVLGEQGSGLHDLSGLAIAALRHAELPPCLLHGMLAVGAQALDGRDGFTVRHVNRRDAGAHSLAIEMDGAGPAGADAAAELGTR